MPPYSINSRLFNTVAQNLHTLVVQGIGFAEIEQVKAHWLALPPVWNFKEKPLSMPICVDVILQK